MAWNEPGDRDSWKPRPSGGGSGPEDWLRKLEQTVTGLFGGNGRSGLITVAVLALLLWGLLGIYQVNEQERAVVLRLGVYHATVGPGLHWNPPIIDSVSKVNATRLRAHSARGLMLTRNVNLVEVVLSVQYNIADPKAFVLNVRDPERSLQQATESALRHVVGNTELDQVLTEGRARVAVETQERIQAYLDAYGAGVRINRVNIEATAAPQPVQDAFKDVNKAREDEERFKNEAQAYANMVVPEARGKAKRMLEEAEAYKQEMAARAQGDASRFAQLLTEYRKAPAVTRERLYVEAVQDVMSKNPKVLLDNSSGNSLFYLPLDKLGKASTDSSAGVLDEEALRQMSSRVAENLRSSGALEKPAPTGRGGR